MRTRMSAPAGNSSLKGRDPAVIRDETNTVSCSRLTMDNTVLNKGKPGKKYLTIAWIESL